MPTVTRYRRVSTACVQGEAAPRSGPQRNLGKDPRDRATSPTEVLASLELRAVSPIELSSRSAPIRALDVVHVSVSGFPVHIDNQVGQILAGLPQILMAQYSLYLRTSCLPDPPQQGSGPAKSQDSISQALPDPAPGEMMTGRQD